MNSKTTIDRLREDVTKLKILLDDPQPGLATWNEMVRWRLQKISEYLVEDESGRIRQPAGPFLA